MSIDRDVNMVAGFGRRPLAQVLAQFALWASADDRPQNNIEENTVTQALGVGTQAANCEAPEPTNPNSQRNPVEMGY